MGAAGLVHPTALGTARHARHGSPRSTEVPPRPQLAGIVALFITKSFSMHDCEKSGAWTGRFRRPDTCSCRSTPRSCGLPRAKLGDTIEEETRGRHRPRDQGTADDVAHANVPGTAVGRPPS